VVLYLPNQLKGSFLLGFFTAWRLDLIGEANILTIDIANEELLGRLCVLANGLQLWDVLIPYDHLLLFFLLLLLICGRVDRVFVEALVVESRLDLDPGLVLDVQSFRFLGQVLRQRFDLINFLLLDDLMDLPFFSMSVLHSTQDKFLH